MKQFLLALAISLSGCSAAQEKDETPQTFEWASHKVTDSPLSVSGSPTPTPRPPLHASSYQRIEADRYAAAQVCPEKRHAVQAIAAGAKRNRPRYEAVERATGVPWLVIAGLHMREADFDFRTNLAQGDSLMAFSRHVPRNRPQVGHRPPFTWEEAALDALRFDGLDRANWNGTGNTIYNVIKFNGLGYYSRGIPSPYAYSWTTAYQSGKFVADGVYSPTAIDKQCGVVPLLKSLP